MLTRGPNWPLIWLRRTCNANGGQISETTNETTNEATIDVSDWTSYCVCECVLTIVRPVVRPVVRPLIRVKPTLASFVQVLSSCRMFALTMAIMLLLDVTHACGPGRGGGRRRSPRKLTPLVFKQHVPNVSENTLGASGLNEGKVTREHPRFKELVPNYNSDIIFKDEEGTGADRLMTQRLKEKLNTLAISVMNQWPGVKLRVTEGWDEEGHHAIDSLHYEGRAVDITTSDRDRSKYGMLARLAVEAGFDWVYYESRFHIHCSVKSEKSESTRSGGCFDGNSIVLSRDGERGDHFRRVPIANIDVGDQILVVGADGSVQFSTVLLLLDRDPNQSRLYYQIETESGAQISLTPSHLIFVSESNRSDSAERLGSVSYARDVRIGQFLYTSSIADNALNATLANDKQSIGQYVRYDRIVRIQTITKTGAYAPLTSEGNLIVNSVVASCYAVINDQNIAHWSFLPIRILDNLMHSFTQIAYLLHLNKHKSVRKSVSSHQNGVHWYPKMLYSLSKYFISSTKMY